MATAEIDAGVVRDAAHYILVRIDGERDEYRKRRIRELLDVPETTGPFWRRVVRYRTEEDAEVIFDGRLGHCGTQEWWQDHPLGKAYERARKIRNLAQTAIRDGRHVVRIDDDECAFLKLPRSHFS